MRKTLRKAGLTLVLLFAFIVPVGAAPANASPGDCFVYKAATLPRVYGGCWSGTGSYSIYAQCWEYSVWSGWRYVWRQSPWLQPRFLVTTDVWCAGSVAYYGMYQRN